MIFNGHVTFPVTLYVNGKRSASRLLSNLLPTAVRINAVQVTTQKHSLEEMQVARIGTSVPIFVASKVLLFMSPT